MGDRKMRIGVSVGSDISHKIRLINIEVIPVSDILLSYEIHWQYTALFSLVLRRYIPPNIHVVLKSNLRPLRPFGNSAIIG